jgi:hypothetical protein
MFNFESKLKSAVVVAASGDLQLPTKIPSWLCEGKQLNVLPFAVLFRVNDGPVSALSLGSVGEAPGSILKLRCHCSTFHDWYCFEAAVQVEVVLAGTVTSFVAMLRFGRVPELVGFGTQ